MTSYSCANLLELTRSAFRVCTEYHNLRFVRPISSSRFLRNKSEQANHRGSKDDGDTKHTEYASSFHQTYNRRTYERKRGDYQRERNSDDGNSSRTISFMSNPSTTHYQRLNIDQSASIDSIKSAYYSLSKQYHPDIVGKDDPNAIENFRLITDAYDVLSDPQLKAEYDKQLRPHTESHLENTFTPWRSKAPNNQNQEAVFRMRESNRIFQSKQEEALAREKERNPNRLRAGVFRQDNSDLKDQSNRLEAQIKFVNSLRSAGSLRKSDGNELYRTHLLDTLLRKQQDLRAHDQGSKAMSDEILWLSLATIVGVLAYITLSAVGALYDIDLADYLDRKFSVKDAEDIDVQSDN